jgi:3-hydroxyacyl-[acyl-carrier-protein] dehydratase
MVTATSHKAEELQAETEIVFAHLDGELGQKTLFDPADLLQMMRVLRAFDVGRAADGSPLVEPPLPGTSNPANDRPPLDPPPSGAEA